MKISEYFKTAKGTGVLATADGTGKVNVAVFASPHVVDEETIAFIMIDRLTHTNLQSNPSAAYLYSSTFLVVTATPIHLPLCYPICGFIILHFAIFILHRFLLYAVFLFSHCVSELKG